MKQAVKKYVEQVC